MFDIVIIEDEELERRALRKILETNLDGANVVGEARNGTEAMQLLDTVSFDLMLVDIKIPRPNGLEIIQMVRDRGLNTKVIILTAYDYFEIMQSAIHLKADNFLLKPVRTEDLMKAVSHCLSDAPPAGAAVLPHLTANSEPSVAPPDVAGLGHDAMPAGSPRPTLDRVPAGMPPSGLPMADSHSSVPAGNTRAPASSLRDEPAQVFETTETGEVARQVAALVDKTAYRDCLWLVRRHLETIYARKDVAPRRAILEYVRAMVQVVDDRGLQLPPGLSRQIDALMSQRLDLHSHFHMQELLYQLTDVLFEAAEVGGAHAPGRVQDVLNYIERNMHKGVTLEDAAEFAQISPCYLSRLFRKEMEMTFISYLKSQRIERAKQLLKDSDLPITNVSLDLSFQDANYFCKAFKKEVGVSPSEYRRRYRHRTETPSATSDAVL